MPVAYETATADQTTAGSWPRHQHGRPACPLISFGVGGKVALMIPKVSLFQCLHIFFVNHLFLGLKISAYVLLAH